MSKKLAFIFPGQGSQHPGMGKSLIEDYDIARKMIDEAGKTIGVDLHKLCVEGPEEELNLTQNTQPAIYTISGIINRILNDNNIYPAVVAGHSLGEYSALSAAKVFDFGQGLKLVRRRGFFMEEALPAGQGTMAAIIGLEVKEIQSICNEVAGICEVANYNTPRQIVISGEMEAVKAVAEICRERGAKKVIELTVSGPFHSSLMKPAQAQLQAEIEKITFRTPEIPVVVNAYATYTEDVQKIKQALIAQLTSSVRWVESIERIVEKGVTTFLEVGPGRTLKGLLRRIDRSLTVYSVRDSKSLQKVIDKMEGNAE